MKIVLTALALSIWLTTLRASEPRTLATLSAYLQRNARSESEFDGSSLNTKQCFAIYLPLLEDVGSQWSTGYNNCITNETALRNVLLSNSTIVQDDIRQAALGIESYIENCLNVTDPLGFFDCFSQFSKQKLAQVYAISFNASADALHLNHKLSDIEVDKYLCTNQTERDYITKSATVYDALDYCLQYGPPQTASAATTIKV